MIKSKSTFSKLFSLSSKPSEEEEEYSSSEMEEDDAEDDTVWMETKWTRRT